MRRASRLAALIGNVCNACITAYNRKIHEFTSMYECAWVKACLAKPYMCILPTAPPTRYPRRKIVPKIRTQAITKTMFSLISP